MNVRPLALAALLAVAVPAQEGFEHVLPADALFFVGVADVEAFGAGFRASAGGRFWHDPANAPLREALEARIDALTAQMHAELGVDPLDFVDMLHGRVALASIGRPTAEDLAADEPQGFAMAFLADVGEDREACEKLVSALADRLATTGGAVRKSTLAGETEVSVLEMDDDPADEASVRMKHAFHGDTLLVTLEAHPLRSDPMELLLARLDGEAGEALADVPAFRSSLAATTGGLQAWVDLGSIMGLVREHLKASGEDDEALQLLGQLGLYDLGCLAMSSQYLGDGSRFDLRLDWEGAGWIPTFARLLCVPGTARTLGAVPADCRQSITARVDFAGLFDAVVKALIDSGAVTMPEVVEGLAAAEEVLGFDPRDDLLEALDGELTFVTCDVEPEDALPWMEGDPQNIVLIAGLRDGTRVNTLVEDAVRRTGLHAARKRAEFQGYEMFSVPLFPGLEVSYAVLPDMAVFSTSGTLVQDVLRRKASPDLPALGTDAEFRTRLGSLAQAPGMVQYTDTAASVKGALRMLGEMSAMMLGMTAELGEDVGPAAGLFSLLSGLPEVDEALVDRHFQGASVSVVAVDEHGLLMQAVSP